MSVSVLIVNYQTPALTIEAVRSALLEKEATEIIVVENGSADGSWEVLQEHFATSVRVKLIKSERNLGFGGGNNLAARAATQPLLFLLNSDAGFVPGCLSILLEQFGTVDDAGIIAPAVFRGTTRELQIEACGPIPTARRILTQQSKNYGTSTTPDWVGGAAMLIPSALFQSVGGFDEDIFMYFEDVLLCWRVRRLGYEIYRNLNAGVEHLGGMSYESDTQKKTDYFLAQDVFLKKIGENLAMRSLVKLGRIPVTHARRTLASRMSGMNPLPTKSRR